MKVAIVVITYNVSSRIFILQVQAIQKFCKDDFDIQVFDNSTDQPIYEQIKYHAEQFGLNYTKTFAGGRNSSDSHSFAANLAYQKLKDYDAVCFLDHDCLPVVPFSIEEILKGGHVMAGIGQGAKKKYMWPGALIISNERIETDIIDFSPNSEFGLDTGGNLYKAIEKYGQDQCVFFNEAYYQNPYFRNHQYDSYAMINNEMFLHMICGSNWNNKERHEERINSLINIVKEKTGL